MSGFVMREAQAADNAGLLRLLGVAQPSRGVMLTFERAPDYFHSVAVTHEKPHILVAESRKSGEIVGVASFGTRQLFINGTEQAVRYGSDLRIAAEHQGSRLIIYITRAVREVLQEQGWYQAIILEDNQRTREVLEGARAGLPQYRANTGLETWTLSGRKRKAEPASLSGLAVRRAAPDDIPGMNRFLRDMAAHYQFLPAYDFSSLLQDVPYFRGLTLDDFLLVHEGETLRGMVALWNQKAFKQTRVVGYNALMTLLRPFYNVWARHFGGFVLPPAGGTFSYRVLHSLLTAPQDGAAFEALLDAAWEESLRRDAGQSTTKTTTQSTTALTLTLADNDPRRSLLARFRSLSLRGRHYTVAFNEAAHPELDSTRIPYFECGRL
ncbi:MAG: GNAT family N-acetyltransferase [Moraxellaceae bacterium]